VCTTWAGLEPSQLAAGVGATDGGSPAAGLGAARPAAPASPANAYVAASADTDAEAVADQGSGPVALPSNPPAALSPATPRASPPAPAPALAPVAVVFEEAGPLGIKFQQCLDAGRGPGLLPSWPGHFHAPAPSLAHSCTQYLVSHLP
jgi:hypothetical protein